METERFKAYTYEELIARDKANLDITWLRDPSRNDADNLPAPEVLAAEIVEDPLTRPPVAYRSPGWPSVGHSTPDTHHIAPQAERKSRRKSRA